VISAPGSEEILEEGRPATDPISRIGSPLTRARTEHIVHMHNKPEGALPRPRKRRCCRAYEGDRVFKPRSIPMLNLDTVRLELGELEAMRLCDLDGLDQHEAGRRMGVSRGTVQRLLKSGRAKVLETIVGTKALIIERGDGDEDLCADAQ
jgi:predicted DNA-binding protein (UPF0251 family)